MGKLIDADQFYAKRKNCNKNTLRILKKWLDDEPAVEIRKHGIWGTLMMRNMWKETQYMCQCSICGSTQKHETAYCGRCGARMDGEK